jgi:hypothetical protein
MSKCSNPDCVPSIFCHEGNEPQSSCPNFHGNKATVEAGKASKSKAVKKSQLTWDGVAFKTEDLSKVTYRNLPIIIGIMGKADAGKTTFLAMLYTLLLRGEKFEKFNFAGSKSLLGWDELYHKLKVKKNKVAFPDPTPVEYLRLHHLALKDRLLRLYDVFLCDASGEVFSDWSQNRDDIRADNARWVYSHSTAFILFIDCDDLIKRKNRAKTEIIDIAQMMLHDIKDRAVIAVWSKADLKEQVHEVIQADLSNELVSMFENFNQIDISNFSQDDPDSLVHENNIKVIDWLLARLVEPTAVGFQIQSSKSDDPFIYYKGR